MTSTMPLLVIVFVAISLSSAFPQGAPPPEYSHKDAAKSEGFRGSSAKGESANAQSAAGFRQSEGEAAQGSQAVFNALRAKSRGKSSSKGKKIAQKEMAAEEWDDAHQWDEDMEVVDDKRQQVSHGKVKEAQAMEGKKASASKVDAKDIEAGRAEASHDERINN